MSSAIEELRLERLRCTALANENERLRTIINGALSALGVGMIVSAEEILALADSDDDRKRFDAARAAVGDKEGA